MWMGGIEDGVSVSGISRRGSEYLAGRMPRRLAVPRKEGT